MHMMMTFDNPKYGSISILLPAMLLDPKACFVILVVDSFLGSSHAAMMKLLTFLRTISFYSHADVKTFEQLPYAPPPDLIDLAANSEDEVKYANPLADDEVASLLLFLQPSYTSTPYAMSVWKH